MLRCDKEVAFAVSAAFPECAMPSTTIHVPMSLNRQFATQACLLVRSLARNGALPGEWNVVLTVSRDTDLSLDTPLLDWTRDFPVSVHWVPQIWWERLHWSGTGLQMHLYQHDADAVLFMDADTIVAGPLTDLIESVSAEPTIAAWPAWQPPPDIDIDLVLRECGLADAPRDLTYSGFGLAFESPRHCPPYFNAGFFAVNGAVARDMAQTLVADFEDVAARFKTWYVSQLALCVNILRHGYRYRALDMRYNASNGAWDPQSPPPFPSLDSAAVVAALNAMIDDVRVLHYCVPTDNFSRKRDMDGLDRVQAFCDRAGMDSGSQRLQRALRPLLMQ
jgi:hypothetical protein